MKNQSFPADLFLLSAFEINEETAAFKKTGHCYVQTKNLDGETNLKQKQAIAPISMLCFPD